MEADILFVNGRFAASMYLAGYAMECALKARICTALAWSDFRTTGYYAKPMKTHDFVFLLGFTGIESIISGPTHLTDWSVVTQWNPDLRYEPASSVTAQRAQDMLDSAKRLIAVL